MSTLLQMRGNVRTDLVVDPQGDVWSNATIDRYINRFIGNVYSWMNMDFQEVTDTFTLVASTATYDLNNELSNYGVLQSLRLDGRNYYLDEIQLEEWEDGNDMTYEGEPLYYYFYGDNTIGLWPVPDGVITTINARYERAAPTLTDPESPAWDASWHYVAELYAIWRCLAAVPGYEEKAQVARSEFMIEEAKMKEALWERDNEGRRFAYTDSTVWPN